MSDSPDEYSHLWYRQQLRGITHAHNRALSDYVDLWEEVRALRKTLEALVELRENDAAEIGRLHERIENAAKVVQAIKQGVKNGITSGH